MGLCGWVWTTAEREQIIKPRVLQRTNEWPWQLFHPLTVSLNLLPLDLCVFTVAEFMKARPGNRGVGGGGGDEPINKQIPLIITAAVAFSQIWRADEFICN